MSEDPIRCMQLPLSGIELLLPNSAVAEIIGYAMPDETGDARGYHGRIHWRGVTVPVVSVEGLCELADVAPSSRSRIAIIYHPDGDSSEPYLGLILQDIPRGYIAEAERMQSVLDGSDCRFLLGRADPMTETLMVPDLDALFNAVHDLQ